MNKAPHSLRIRPLVSYLKELIVVFFLFLRNSIVKIDFYFNSTY